MTPRTVDVTIDSIAAGGDGVARADGMVVFVPRTAPGDVARVRIDPRAGGRFARGTLDAVLSAAPDRVEPPCAHYRDDACGGCQLQHIGYDAQLESKAGIIRDALQRIGRREIALPAVRPSAERWRYRSKLTLAVRGRGARRTIGLHRFDDPAAVFQLNDCPITRDDVMSVWRQIFDAAALLPEGRDVRVAVRATAAGSAVVAEGGTEWSAGREFFDRVPGVGALWWKPANGRRTKVAERRALPAGASFGQVNPRVAADLRAHVVERVRSHEPSTVIDAYSGVGETAVELAAGGARVIAIEWDRDAARHCGELLPAGSSALAGPVEDLLAGALPADAVILNPPRGGCDERVTAALQTVAEAPRVILYVSCNPATLARDLSRMARYRIASLTAFDMFPQTAHVETVCELVPEAA